MIKLDKHVKQNSFYSNGIDSYYTDLCLLREYKTIRWEMSGDLCYSRLNSIQSIQQIIANFRGRLELKRNEKTYINVVRNGCNSKYFPIPRR